MLGISPTPPLRSSSSAASPRFVLMAGTSETCRTTESAQHNDPCNRSLPPWSSKAGAPIREVLASTSTRSTAAGQSRTPSSTTRSTRSSCWSSPAGSSRTCLGAPTTRRSSATPQRQQSRHLRVACRVPEVPQPCGRRRLHVRRRPEALVRPNTTRLSSAGGRSPSSARR